jgi:hypothetical protein
MKKIVPEKKGTPHLKENDRVLIRSDEGEERTVIVRWLDSMQGILTKPDYEYYRTPESVEVGYDPPAWTVIKKLPRLKKKKK